MRHQLKAHLAYNRELYVYFPLFALLCWGAIAAVNLLTGRPVTDSPEAVVGFLYNALGIVVAVILTGLTQAHLFKFRSERTAPDAPIRMRDDIYDACVSFGLLSLFLYRLWH